MVEGWLTTLRDALDLVEYGAVLFDETLQVSFFNQADRRMRATPTVAAPADYTFARLMAHAQIVAGTVLSSTNAWQFESIVREMD